MEQVLGLQIENIVKCSVSEAYPQINFQFLFGKYFLELHIKDFYISNLHQW